MDRSIGCGLVVAACLLAGLPASAQEKVLRGSQVTESALVDALEIEGPKAPDDAQTRGFGPMSVAKRKTGPGKASLLITFATDSAELSADAKAALDTVGRALQSDRLAAFAFRVEGHADPRGGADHNQRLSQARAEAVVGYLVAQHGLLPERLKPVGKGSAELLDSKRVDAPENRRVTIVTTRE
jgi:outer membrane protein OmpA-like peptidoglycan-associated protein